MLQAIRDKVTGWIAYGIIFLISIPFALWGVNSYLGGGELAPAAIVNGEEITQRHFDQSYANYRQRLSQLFGGSIPATFGDESMLREQVRDQLIEDFALRQYVQEHRYRLSDEALNRIIWDMEIFHSDGVFDSERFKAQLRSIGYSPTSFKQEVHGNQTLDQFQRGIVETAFTLPDSDKQFASLSNQTRKIRSLNYRLDRDSILIDAAAIEQHYEKNASWYQIPEQIKIDYIDISLDSIKRGISIEADSVRARYEENINAYTIPEIRQASHILLKVGSDEDAVPTLAKIDTLRARIVNGESFADLAREYSEDSGSAPDGGDLGEIERGDMVPAFESALFALQVDQLSEPVKTQFGWHLIKLHAISGGGAQSFESVQAELEDEIKTEMAESQIYDLVESLSNLAYEQSDSLLPAAEQLDLSIETSDWFDRASGSGIAAEPKVRAQAFAADVLEQGLNSEAIELGPDRVVFIRRNQVKPPTQRPLEEVRDQIETELRNLKVRDQSQQTGAEALAALIDGKSLDELAQEWSATITDHGFIERGQTGLEDRILRTVFAMPKPHQGAVYEGLSLSSGDYAIIELSAVLSNDSNVDQEAIDSLAEAHANAEYQSVLKLVTSRAEVVKTPLEELQ